MDVSIETSSIDVKNEMDHVIPAECDMLCLDTDADDTFPSPNKKMKTAVENGEPCNTLSNLKSSLLSEDNESLCSIASVEMKLSNCDSDAMIDDHNSDFSVNSSSTSADLSKDSAKINLDTSCPNKFSNSEEHKFEINVSSVNEVKDTLNHIISTDIESPDSDMLKKKFLVINDNANLLEKTDETINNKSEETSDKITSHFDRRCADLEESNDCSASDKSLSENICEKYDYKTSDNYIAVCASANTLESENSVVEDDCVTTENTSKSGDVSNLNVEHISSADIPVSENSLYTKQQSDNETSQKENLVESTRIKKTDANNFEQLDNTVENCATDLSVGKDVSAKEQVTSDFVQHTSNDSVLLEEPDSTKKLVQFPESSSNVRCGINSITEQEFSVPENLNKISASHNSEELQNYIVAGVEKYISKSETTLSDSNMMQKSEFQIFAENSLSNTEQLSSGKVNHDIINKKTENFEEGDKLDYIELSKEETGFPAIFEGSVVVGKYISVKGDFTLKSSEALIESPSFISPFLLKEPDKFPSKEEREKSENKGFFRSTAGEFLIGIGLSRVTEWFHRDMARIKTRQIKKNGKFTHLEQELEFHQNSYLQAKKANEPFVFPYKSCKFCNFSTESSIVLEGHLLVPHITSRREYQCNFCSVINRDPREMLFHMEATHGKIGRIQPPVLFYECPSCIFETNSKAKLNSHLNKCLKYFDRGTNQAPPKDFEFPGLTPKPITVAVVKAYEKSLSCMHRGRGRPKKIDSVPDTFHHHLNQFSANRPVMSTQSLPMYHPVPNMTMSDGLCLQNQMIPSHSMSNSGIRPAHSNVMGQMRPGLPPLHVPSANQFFQVMNSTGQMLPVLGSNQFVTAPSQFPYLPGAMNSGQKKSFVSNSSFHSNPYGSSVRPSVSKSSDIPQLPKLQGPYPVQLSKALPSSNTSVPQSSLVVCEICDGYIKDLEQLRTHMQLIHKVKIHPKMLVSRPPLNCQKCQWRFFTDQGLERHLLGAHGLVTSNMQELANKNKDAGCCTICGRVYASKLVAHMNQVHKVTLKPAHLSYKCTVCSATFNLYRLFENHVYLVHSGAAKRPAENSSPGPNKKFAKSSNFEKSLSEDTDNAKSPAEKENDIAQKKKCNAEEKTEEFVVKKCVDCGTEMKDLTLDKRRHLKHDSNNQDEKCEKCLKLCGLDLRLDSSKELKDNSKINICSD